MQLFDDEFADRFEFDVLDPTKIIPEEDVPIRRVGRLVLDRVVDNFFAETEQVAFCTQNIVDGIDFTNDPLLQGRNFSYLDTQLKRLGSPNFTDLPINAPKCPFATLPTGRAHGHRQPRRADQLRAELLGRADVEAPEDPRRVLLLRRGSRGREAADPARELRRPLQPGPPVLRQPDADRAEAHRRRVRVRAEQGASGPTSASGWWPTCATSTRTSPRARRRRPRPRAARPRTDAAAPPCTDSRRRRRSASWRTARRPSRAARSACSSPTAPTPTILGALRRRATRRRVRRGHRTDGRRRHD